MSNSPQQQTDYRQGRGLRLGVSIGGNHETQHHDTAWPSSAHPPLLQRDTNSSRGQEPQKVKARVHPAEPSLQQWP